MRVLIGCNSAKSGSAELAAELVSLLKGRGFTPCLFENNFPKLDIIGAEIVSSASSCDFVVTVGGDGTILKWGKIAAEYDIPLIGVNMGRLGFMATVEPSDIGMIPDILSGELNISERMMLDCAVFRDDRKIFSECILNDIILSRGIQSKLPEFSVFCGNSEVSRVRADGVIFGTPTGSTAYSLSAGGPIIAPDLECIEFTALCPHTLFNRPMIFSDKQVIIVKVNHYCNSHTSVIADGGKAVPFLDGDVLRLTRSKQSLKIIEAGEGFYGSIHNKLMTPIK